MKPIRVLLADDHALVRAGFRVLLRDAGIDVVGEASDGHAAIELVKNERPDIVLMDIMMPGLNGLEATARIAGKFANTRVIMLSMNTTKEYVLQSLQAGARGYLLKSVQPEELVRGVQAVARGEVHLSSTIAQHVTDALTQKAPAGATALGELTPRQREVLQLIAEGKSSKEIAKALKLGVKTIETYRAQLMETLDIHEIAGLVRYAIRMGIVSAEV